MDSDRKTAKIVGALILIAYCIVLYEVFDSSIVKLVLELISGGTVVAMAVLMFPILKSHNKPVTQGYLISKGLEGLVMIAAGILIFTELIKSDTHESIYEYHTYLFALAYLILTYLLYLSKLVPKQISIWGLIASIIFWIATAVKLAGIISFDPNVTILPFVVLNEIVLAIWLIAKGFSLEEIDSEVTVAAT